ncbi:hypothetical protein WA026_013537 [Henosepilachna vigintioctopunctata]|uniref:Uncharacterized protein n=1 Tax=Henosepilachna vigintioctopunctata TaxID=420089 RepID=A0AAW1V6A2_9CUCU
MILTHAFWKDSLDIGSNICCRDKNYGGLLIICDRIFERFASEKNNKEIIYGLVVISPSFNLPQLQKGLSRKVGPYLEIGWRNFHQYKTKFYILCNSFTQACR